MKSVALYSDFTLLSNSCLHLYFFVLEVSAFAKKARKAPMQQIIEIDHKRLNDIHSLRFLPTIAMTTLTTMANADAKSQFMTKKFIKTTTRSRSCYGFFYLQERSDKIDDRVFAITLLRLTHILIFIFNLRKIIANCVMKIFGNMCI